MPTLRDQLAKKFNRDLIARDQDGRYAKGIGLADYELIVGQFAATRWLDDCQQRIDILRRATGEASTALDLARYYNAMINFENGWNSVATTNTAATSATNAVAGAPKVTLRCEPLEFGLVTPY